MPGLLCFFRVLGRLTVYAGSVRPGFYFRGLDGARHGSSCFTDDAPGFEPDNKRPQMMFLFGAQYKPLMLGSRSIQPT